MENSFPEGSSLHTHHEKLFITQKETRTDHLVDNQLTQGITKSTLSLKSVALVHAAKAENLVGFLLFLKRILLRYKTLFTVTFKCASFGQ